MKINFQIGISLTLLFWNIFSLKLNAQEELLQMLGEEETTSYTIASFKTNRIINLHSIENTAAGVLDFKIQHRFGYLNGGIEEFFGIDQATMRFGFDYGLTNRLQIGLGRSNYEKTLDGYLKFKLLRQSSGQKKMPLSASIVAGSAIKTNRWPEPDRNNLFSSRLSYHFQILLARKFSEGFSFQLTPTLVHRNLVATSAEKNDVYALGAGFRQKITKRISVNAEYIYVFPDQLAPEYKNSVSLGFDIETGGHVFQLHFTNSTGMFERAFIAETVGDVGNGDIRFGFNLSRVFTLSKPKAKE